MNKTPYPSPHDWQRPFFTIWIGQAISLIGSSLVQFALIWWLTEKTQSATALATASLLVFLPNTFLAPFAGVVVDRYNRRILMIASDALVAISTLGLAILFLTGGAEVFHVYIVLLVRAIAGNFQFPAMRASTSLLVPESHLSKVAGYNQILHNSLRIVTPPLGAILLNMLPLQNILMIDVVTALLGITPLFFVFIPQPSPMAEQHVSLSLWKDLRSGGQYIISMPGFIYIIAIISILNFLLDPAFSLTPLLVQNHFGGGAMQFAWVQSAASIGGLASGLIFSLWVVRRKVLTSMLGVAGVGLGCLMMGLAPPNALWLAIAGSFLITIMMGISDAPMGALLQARIAPEMQGRVFSVMGSLMTVLSPLSLLVAGPLADRIGVQIWFVAGGAMCLFLGLIATRMPLILQLEDQPSINVTVSTQPPGCPKPGPE
jgi:DHA3 family macrolide efflux protein-like MFS transporter